MSARWLLLRLTSNELILIQIHGLLGGWKAELAFLADL